MEFSDQNYFVILNEINNLNALDLYNICTTNSRLNNLCNSENIWSNRLLKLFPDIDLSKYSNLRDFYFKNHDI